MASASKKTKTQQQQITAHTLAFQFCYFKMTVMNAVNPASTSLQSQTTQQKSAVLDNISSEKHFNSPALQLQSGDHFGRRLSRRISAFNHL